MYPFEATLEKIMQDPEKYIDAVFNSLKSEFLIIPKGIGFIEYPIFERGYEALKIATSGFKRFETETIYKIALKEPITIIVIRTILGFTPSEWGYIATQNTGISITQGFIRSLDRKIRISPESSIDNGGVIKKRLLALIDTACKLINAGVPKIGSQQLHRLDKADTKYGIQSIKSIAAIGVPYAMLLYERFLGRPFAGHRDSVSELIGDSLESAVEEVLSRSNISYRKTKRAERVAGFDQAPDFIIPSEFNPQVVIEAKITEDDGTARDKVTRIQHLGELSSRGGSKKNPKFEVIACIGGRGFSVRREDMKKMILATKGKVFTIKTLDKMTEFSRLKYYSSK